MSRGPVVIIASAALLVIAAVAVVIVFRHVSHSPAPSAAASQSTTTVAQAPQAVQPTDTTSDTTAPQTTEPPVTTMDETSAQTALDQQVSTDHTAVEQLVGSWVPQLSAKKVGLVADGITYDYESILNDYQNQVAQHPGALLLKSGDYSSFKFPGFYVTVAPQSFGSAAAANQWCDSQNIDADNCFAKRLMHTGGYQGNTVGRK
jgi:serine/threonine-protein kinase